MSRDDGDDGDRSLSLDAVLHVLADRYRRDLLRYLIDKDDETATVEECTNHLIEREAERTGERPAYDQVEVRLHHVHVPKLSDTGVIEYDPRSREFRYWGHARLEAWLDRIEAAAAEEGE